MLGGEDETKRGKTGEYEAVHGSSEGLPISFAPGHSLVVNDTDQHIKTTTQKKGTCANGYRSAQQVGKKGPDSQAAMGTHGPRAGEVGPSLGVALPSAALQLFRRYLKRVPGKATLAHHPVGGQGP